MTRAVALVSGGLDSTVAAAVARSEGFALLGLSVDYGQRHRRELAAAKKVARSLGFEEHRTVSVGLSDFGGSALTDKATKVPLKRSVAEMAANIPVTYVPARNTIMLSLALAYSEVTRADAIFIGANAIDYSGYPDCRPEFLGAFERLANLATKRGVEGERVEIRAPLLKLSKADIVRLGKRLAAPLELTWSCYLGGRRPCGQCDSCILRAKGFAEAGMPDPALNVRPTARSMRTRIRRE